MQGTRQTSPPERSGSWQAKRFCTLLVAVATSFVDRTLTGMANHMRPSTWLAVLLISWPSAMGPGQAPATSEPRYPCRSIPSSAVLQPSDPGYDEAQRFATFLGAHGFDVRCVARSKSQGFLDNPKAASIQTDAGPIAVVFFPAPDGAERVHIAERPVRGGYAYTFTTRQPGLAARTTWTQDAPARLLRCGTWFVEVWDAGLYDRLNEIFETLRPRSR
jgi:hypothetical protein